MPVVLSGPGLAAIGGYVDAKMEDGSALWIRDETWSRRLIHRSDGYAVRVVNCSSEPVRGPEGKRH
ncbi:hypothetical protein [Arthrobacter sp. SD76]|uniref:hypothetical protein n=1 Tax=Arthrobacter sp. SD76 TaxID=3415007 RepID=UPI003C753993